MHQRGTRLTCPLPHCCWRAPRLSAAAAAAEAAYKNEMLPTSVPEIQRTNLAMTVSYNSCEGGLLRCDCDNSPAECRAESLLLEAGSLAVVDIVCVLSSTVLWLQSRCAWVGGRSCLSPSRCACVQCFGHNE